MAQFELVAYRPEYALEVVKMWRQSFQRAMGLEEHNRFDQLNGQLDYFCSINPRTIELMLAPQTSTVVGFMVCSGRELQHLYVHVDCWGMGIGSMLLGRAQQRSDQGLELFTFQANKSAQAFYLARGFVEVARGSAAWADNPWATSIEQLADIRYNWTP